MKCLFCDCTEDRACSGGCSWALPEVCSACVHWIGPGGARWRVISVGEGYVTLKHNGAGAGVAMVNTLGAFSAADAAKRAGLPTAWVVHESFELADFSFLNWGPAGLEPRVKQRWEHSLGAVDRLLFVADATKEMFARYSQPQRIGGTGAVAHVRHAGKLKQFRRQALDFRVCMARGCRSRIV